MAMEIQLAVAKINKHGTMESGDTLESVERPNGGQTVVMADALVENHFAKVVSSAVVRTVTSRIAEGVRDGAAIRAASDALFTDHNGQVGSYLNVISVDLQTCTVVISRNNPTPTYVCMQDRIENLSGECSPIGLSRNIKPSIVEIPLEVGLTVLSFTEGLIKAGQNSGLTFELVTLLESLLDEQEPSAQSIADTILYEAIRMDNNQPQNDMSLVVLRVMPRSADSIRKMIIHLPYGQPDCPC
ncbi:MAG: serine/threonine-protein phosphatase [Chloroflexi bacterium]|nr:serine/threonine-protein phosphatase [Chloroflexota bacterium]